MNLRPHAELASLSCDLGKALKLFGFSRVLVGGVALIISILTRPNDQSHVTLGPHALTEGNFLMHERNVLQSLLAAGLSRHGISPTPWHSSRTGPCNTPPGATDTYLDTLPRPQDYPDPIPPRLAPSSRTQTLFPIFHNPPLARAEAQRRGLDILQILHALLEARQLGHREDQDETGETPTDPERLELMDLDSQRLGLTFLKLLSTTPEVNPTPDNHWKEFVLAMSFSRDLLASLTHAIANPLADDLVIVSLQGVESLYTELEVKPWTPDEMEVPTMITLLISEGLLSHVLIKTRQHCQRQESQPYTDAAGLLLTLSLRANTTDVRIRMELNQAIHTLSVEGDVQILDLLIGWLEDALSGFPWIWPTVRNAKTIPLLINRMDATCHQAQKLSDMNFGLRAAEVPCLLCQDSSFWNDILDTGTHRLLQTADKA